MVAVEVSNVVSNTRSFSSSSLNIPVSEVGNLKVYVQDIFQVFEGSGIEKFHKHSREKPLSAIHDKN